MANVIERCWRRIGRFITGEWMFFGGCVPNGGAVVLYRAVQITFIFYAVALLLNAATYAEWTWEFWKWPCQFDFGQLKKDISKTVLWVGPIFAAVYAALYARFASQWSYLAGVYNQIRQAHVTWTDHDNDHMNHWKAGFVEDALDLHLATKPLFAQYILRIVKISGVRESFIENAAGNGAERLAQLEGWLS